MGNLEKNLKHNNATGKDRRTLNKIDRYPEPNEILTTIQNRQGWDYKTNMDYYRTRDRALVSLLYLAALRISEGLRLTRDQFTIKADHVLIESILLSKRHRKGKRRVTEYRKEIKLPLAGEREPLTQMVMEYLKLLEPKEQLFKFGPSRALQITGAILGVPNHWLRAFGESYLYSAWNHDLLAVSDYVCVDSATLQKYIRRGYEKYPVV